MIQETQKFEYRVLQNSLVDQSDTSIISNLWTRGACCLQISLIDSSLDIHSPPPSSSLLSTYLIFNCLNLINPK